MSNEESTPDSPSSQDDGPISRHNEDIKKEEIHQVEDSSTLPLDPEVEAILNQSDLLPLLKEHLDNIIAGEDNGKLTVFLLLLSGKSSDPSMKEMILLKSGAGAGKTTLMKIAYLFRVKPIGRLSKTAIDYMEHGDYDILLFQELGLLDDEKFGVSTIKLLSGDDEGYTIEITTGSPKDGFTTMQKTIPPKTVISGTTRLLIDPQFERRNWIIGLDESPEQTAKIRDFKANQEREKLQLALGQISETSSVKSRRLLKQLVNTIEPVNVILLFPETLMMVLSDKHLRVRGDFDKVLHAVKYYGMLKQRTLPKIRIEDKEIVFITPEAAVQVLNVIREPLALMAMDLDMRTKKMLSLFNELELKKGGYIYDSERKELSELSKLSPSTIHTYLNHLETKGYLQGVKAGRSKAWQLKKSPETIEREASILTNILDNPSIFIPKMREEAMSQLELLPPEIVQPILSFFKPSREV